MKSFSRFRNDKELLPEEVNSDIIEAYETYLESVKVCPNTISFYMRNLRAIYNRAVAKELTVQRFPFKQVYTGIDKTVKRAVSIEVIRQIRDLDLTLHPSMEYARDMFLFFILHSWYVLCRYGISVEKRLTKWSFNLSSP